MPFKIVDPATVAAGRGPHPAASPFDKRISENLGVSAFEVYQVELPAGEATESHTHLEDRVEDLYVVIGGDGWLVVDGESIPIRAGQFIAVTLESTRHVLAGSGGLTLVAVCGAV